MSYLEIFFFGILINFTVMVFLIIINVLIGFLNLFNPQYMQGLLELEKTNREIHSIKEQLKSKNKIYVTQEDFLVFLPFSYIAFLLQFMYLSLKYNNLYALYYNLKIKLNKLNQED